ncbi:PREDICTED: lipase member I isoform X3 [Cercocebus atys]|uniref:lipase member I isoform X3 n=1 Tax=Cercocebus atys TaxID=9531 RepID=UPI0005F37DD0|nr:PREDICTED: lipase member I isoform X3 [Cercocebus atys]
MRVYIFLCLMCWVKSGYFSLSSKSKPVSRKSLENERPCLEFSHLSIKDSFRDLFIPRIEIILMMYTRNNLNCAKPLFEHNNSLNVNFNTQKKTVWLIHGYRPMGSIPSWLQNFVSILLNEEDMNVIVVDWNRGATTFIYDRAVKNTRKVAVSLSGHIKNLLKHGASLDNFHFIGMSLGAHISGFVGKIFNGQLGRITGLDPAGPKFSRKPPYRRLDYTDAKFVDVIHSNSHGLGIREPLGHIDFYPNGGRKQPGCPKSIFSGYQAKLFKDVLKERIKGGPVRTTVFLDTSGIYPFCTYYFILSITVPDKTVMDGFFSFKLLNQLGMIEEARFYKKNKPLCKLQEIKILAQFYNDFANISSIGLTYFQSSNMECSTCTYKIQSLMLKSLTYPERPPLCRYNIVLKEKEEVFLYPNACTPKKT